MMQLLQVVGFLLCLGSCWACSPVNFEHFSMEKILYLADIVVYGKETERYLADPLNDNTQKNARFEVYCVLKNNNIGRPISNSIVIERVYPVTSCSGTVVPANTDVLLALQRTSSGNFVWHEVNVTPDGAAFVVRGTELKDALTVCGLRAPVLPSGRNENLRPTCPVVTPLDGGCINGAMSQHRLTISLLSTVALILSIYILW